MQVKKVKSNNVDTFIINTKKFKTINIQVVFLGEFSKEKATTRSLLTRLLSNSTKKYPTKSSLANKMMDLYDASYSVTTYPSYKTSITVFSLSFINEKSVNEKALTVNALEFLNELIRNPNIVDGEFLEKDYLEQKRILKESIKGIYNSKNRYAFRQLVNNMAEGEIMQVSSLGHLEDLEKITNKDLVNLYDEMLTRENVSIYISGDVEETDILNKLKVLGNFNNNPKSDLVVSHETKEITEVREFSEFQIINQSKIIMGFRTEVNTQDDLFPALLLFNAMFGGTFTSDLTRVVREEHSLAYTIASQVLSDIKLMIVTAGIDKAKAKLTTELVVKELEAYKNAKVNEDLMKLALDGIINELTEIEDSSYSMINHVSKNYIIGKELTVEELIEQFKKVSVSDIVEVAKGIRLDSVFLLGSEDENA